MADDKWTQRKPGRVSGTVVPPPTAEETPPLPQRRVPGRSKHKPQTAQPSRAGTPPPSPELPDNVRPLFKPVLRQREFWPTSPSSLKDVRAPSAERSRAASSQANLQPAAANGRPRPHDQEAVAAGAVEARATAAAVIDRVPTEHVQQGSGDGRRSGADAVKSPAAGHPRNV